MANEFTVWSSLFHSPSNVTHQVPRKQVDQTTNAAVSGVVTVTTTATAFDLSGITTPGLAYFVNLDSGSDTVQIGIVVSATFYPFADIRPGIPNNIDLSSAVKSGTPLQHKTVSGTAALQFAIYDE